MSNPRRKARWRRQRAAASAGGYPAGDRRVADLGPVPAALRSPHTLPSYDACHSLEWIPDLDNAHLLVAARGLSSLALPLHPPAPVRITLPRRHGRSWAARC